MDEERLPPAVQEKLSGKVGGTSGCQIRGKAGMADLTEGMIAARRHIHRRPRDGDRFGGRNGQTVRLQTLTARPVIFQNVAVRISDEFAPQVHPDDDVAGDRGFRPGDPGRTLP